MEWRKDLTAPDKLVAEKAKVFGGEELLVENDGLRDLQAVSGETTDDEDRRGKEEQKMSKSGRGGRGARERRSRRRGRIKEKRSSNGHAYEETRRRDMERGRGRAVLQKSEMYSL